MRRLFVYATPAVVIVGLVVWFWHIIMVACAAMIAWRLVLRVHGQKGRDSSFPAKVQAVAVAYAAWNSRWLKPKKGERTATIGKKAQHHDEAENFGTVPFG